MGCGAMSLPAHLAAHIRACLAKTPHHTPAIELNRAAWEAILSVLDDDAGPAAFAAADDLLVVVAQLRHAYAHLHAESVTEQRAFADGLISPQIARLERLLISDPWERPPQPDTPERTAYREATARATAEARKTIQPGDRITRTLCGGARGTFTFTRWDGEALCGRTVSDCHAVNVIAVNGVARRFGDQVEIARASEAFRVAREAERAARGPGRPLFAGDAPTDDPVPWQGIPDVSDK